MEQGVPEKSATPTAQQPSLRRRSFILLLLLSGFCGISYEVLYARILSNFIGDQFAVSAAILLTFMLGIGLGTLFAHRLWRWLWLIEAGIGGFGVAFALGSEQLQSWFYSVPALSRGLTGSMIVCFVLLSAPAFLIGFSLPLFAGYLGRLSSGQVFARAYMIYNFGAALTVLLIEFWLLRWMGVRATVLSMAALNGLVSVALLCGFRELRESPEPALAGLSVPRSHLFALAIASLGSAIFQLLMIKIAECFLGPFRETFALVLALVLIGIALGSAITKRWRVNFGWILLAGLAGLAWLLVGFGLVTGGYAWLHPRAVEFPLTGMLNKVVSLALLMGVPALAFGAIIPALLGELGSVARNSGKLLCISSLANAAGFLLMAAVLHRYLDYGVLIVIIAGLLGLSVLLYAKWRGCLAWCALLLVGAAIGLRQFCWNENLLYLGYSGYQSREDLQSAKDNFQFPERFKGAQDVFSLNHIGDDLHFFINGYVSIRLNSPAEKIVGAFPALFAPRTDRALVLGVGSAATAGTMACLFDKLDAVEINPVVLQNLYRMEAHNFGIVSKPHVNFILDDGLHFMKVCQDTYPLIINTVTSPRYFSSSKLYTRDFLETVRDHVSPDGLYVTWVDDGIGTRGLDIILKTVSQTFKECSLAGIKSGYFLLLCSQVPIQLHQPTLVASNSVLAQYFKVNGLPPEMLPYGLFTTRAYDLIQDPSVPLNTMDYPALEFEMARLDNRHLESFSTYLRKNLNLAELTRVLKPKMDFNLMDYAWQSERLYRNHPLTNRRLELAEREMEDFQERYLEARLRNFANWAAAANTAEVYHEYAAKLLEQRRYSEAIQAEQKALALDPKTDDAFYNIAYSYEKMSQFQPALTNYSNELSLDGKEKRAWLGLGRVHYKLNQHTQALAFLHRAIAVEEKAESYTYLSLVLQALGQTKEAEEQYERGLKIGNKPEGAASPARTATAEH